MDSAHEIEVDDVEAVPHTPEDSESSAIEERPRSFLSRRKKAIAVVVSIVLVVGIAVGVALSVKPSQSAPPDQAGVSKNTQDLSVVNDPSEESSVADDNESVADNDEGVDDIDEGVADIETPQEEFIDDEELDIILDVGSEAEYPDDIIYDEGSEQREPEVELFLPEEGAIVEKPVFSSEDMAVELAEFDGPLTDFIGMTDLSRISNVSSNNQCKENGKALWSMKFVTDRYPWENTWILEDKQGNEIASGPPPLKNYERLTKYLGRMCLVAGEYTMKLTDKNNDGICCAHGQGEMTVEVDGLTVASTNGDNFAVKQFSFVALSGNGSDPKPTLRPTKRPTKRPSKSPTRVPTRKPTTSPPQSLGQNNRLPVNIKVVTDRFGKETGYKLVNSNNNVVVRKNKGDMNSLTTYNEELLLSPGRYTLTIEDSFGGIQDDGFYSVLVDGEEVVYGNKFFLPTVSHVINVGYQPTMTSRERQWLAAHNTRRATFHAAENVSYKKLVWSPELAAEASRWVDEITPACKIIREQGLSYGENISARSTGAGADEGPQVILRRWSDSKILFDYPKNQSRTQVLWRATRFVGCAEKAVQRNNNPNSVCYVTICRYSRPANCGMGGFSDWKEPTLADHSKCGPACAGEEGCY